MVIAYLRIEKNLVILRFEREREPKEGIPTPKLGIFCQTYPNKTPQTRRRKEEKSKQRDINYQQDEN